MKRRGIENVVLRLAKRECIPTPPGAVTSQVRQLYENVVPDTPVTGLAPPPNTVLARFTPCGRFLLAFQPVTNEVVAFTFKGLHLSTTRQQPSEPLPATAAGVVAGTSATVPSPTPAGAVPLSTVSLDQQQQHAEPAAQRATQPISSGQVQQQQQQQQGGPAVSFGDVFEEGWRCCPCPGRQEQISPDVCLVVHGRFLLLCTATPEWQPPAGATGAAALMPHVLATSLHMVDLESGCLLDSYTLREDYVELARAQGIHLRGQLLLVLGLASQTLHVLQLLPAGRFLYLHGVGQHCRDDDGLVLAQHEGRERRLRQHLQRQSQRSAAHGTLASVASAASFGSMPSSISAPPSGAAIPPPPLPSQALSGRPPAAGGAAVAAGSDSEPDDSSGQAAGEGAAGGNGAAAAGEDAEESPMFGGLKQCLLAYLFREAQQQSLDAAAAHSAATSAAAGRVLGGHRGSTGSLAGLPYQRWPASGGASSGPASSTAAVAAPPAPTVPLVGHWRRPLDRFHYQFQAHAELLMWKAQMLDEQRMLIHWCAPEMLAGPHRHQGHGLHSAAHGGGGGGYLMLYNMARAQVERLFLAHSPEFAAWYLQHPAAFHGGGCTCSGCGSEWERCVSPLAGSRAAREAQLRDPAQAAKELRNRLTDELPTCIQLRQATPYLDPDLYCYDERAVGGVVRPHHPPHRSIKFMARCQPERLRFRLDPHNFSPMPAGGGGGGAGGRAGGDAGATAEGAGGSERGTRPHHVVYLFHPVQPFLLVVLQDVETAMADQLTFFTRL